MQRILCHLSVLRIKICYVQELDLSYQCYQTSLKCILNPLPFTLDETSFTGMVDLRKLIIKVLYKAGLRIRVEENRIRSSNSS